MARVCDTADRLWVAPNDCGFELRSTTQAICDAWPLEFERTKLPCACSPMLPAPGRRRSCADWRKATPQQQCLC